MLIGTVNENDKQFHPIIIGVGKLLKTISGEVNLIFRHFPKMLKTNTNPKY